MGDWLYDYLTLQGTLREGRSSAVMLCGDEVGSVVCDIGGAWSKFGSAGEDCPYHVFRSDIGYIEEEMSEGPDRSYRVGDNALRLVQEKLEVVIHTLQQVTNHTTSIHTHSTYFTLSPFSYRFDTNSKHCFYTLCNRMNEI